MGNEIFSFVANIGYCSVLQAEIWAIYVGVNIAWSWGLKKFLVESDSQTTINLLKVTTRVLALSRISRDITNIWYQHLPFTIESSRKLYLPILTKHWFGTTERENIKMEGDKFLFRHSSYKHFY